MLVAIVSDTHRYEQYIKKASKMCMASDMILHLGDNVEDADMLRKLTGKKVISVRGNCDMSIDEPSEKLIEIDGTKIFMTHGHEYGVKYSLLRVKYRALELGAKAVLYGHSHTSSIISDEGIWFINPGSPSLPRDGHRTIAYMDVKNDRIFPYIRQI